MIKRLHMTTMATLLAMLVGVVTVGAQPAAGPLVDPLEESMSDDEFAQAGLHKLTEAELQFLNRWLRQGTANPAVVAGAGQSQSLERVPVPSESAVSPEEQFGLEQLKAKPDPKLPEQITAQLLGEFRGWDGKTVFRLDNGQVWQQRVGGAYRSPKRVNPAVTIEKGRFGYYLSLVGSGRKVGVKRLR